ncbi:hypothetical protein ACP26L_26670 [Paenibacillus sp. S-38]|uniref:hypothetical protein n=1 Tax=Paenibacillus sp. S-38 TaxID=3416710 RepID=UPI003CF9C75E
MERGVGEKVNSGVSKIADERKRNGGVGRQREWSRSVERRPDEKVSRGESK